MFPDSNLGEFKKLMHNRPKILEKTAVRRYTPFLLLPLFFVLSLAVSGLAQENLALNKPARQSSEYGNNGAPARLAVDGYKDGNFSIGSVTHTAEPATTDPWWEVDLGGIYEIREMRIYGRTDCCGERLAGFKVLFRNSESDPWEEKASGPAELQKQRGRRVPQSTFTFAFQVPTTRYIRIMLPGENRILSLAEVEVYGGLVGSTAEAKSCERQPGPEEVFIFERGNYLGECKQLKYRDGNYPYSIENVFEQPDRFRFSNDGPFYSVKVGSNVIVTICNQEKLKGGCKELRDNLPVFEGYARGAQSFKIYTRTPKNYVDPGLPNDDQVTICQERKYSGGCKKLGIGVFDLSGIVYNYIHVGANVKAQTYSDSNQFGNSEIYTGGTKQATRGGIKSIRVMRANDDLAPSKERPRAVPAATPAPTPAKSNIPVAEDNPDKRFILDGSGNNCLTVKGGEIKDYTPVVLETCQNLDSQKWEFTSDGRIRGIANMCLTIQGTAYIQSCQPLGNQHWSASDNNEIRSGWACLSSSALKSNSPTIVECNGSAGQKWRFRMSAGEATTPSGGNTQTGQSTPKIDGPLRVSGNTLLGLTVLNQQIGNNSQIILHGGFNNWLMLPNGAIVLKDNPKYGLTVKNQNIANNSEIILHEGYNLWTVLSDGAIVLKDNPQFGLTVLNQNLSDNAKIILHGGFNTWTAVNSNPKVAAAPKPAPPAARHAPPPGNYSFCADEPYRCNFNYIGTVAFGVNGKFKYKTGVVRGIDCNVATFGDPEPGVPKKCYSLFEREWVPNTTPNESTAPAPPNGSNWKVCGTEGRTCTFTGKGTVAFGYSPSLGGFKFRSGVSNSIPCNASQFGAATTFEKPRACYVRID